MKRISIYSLFLLIPALFFCGCDNEALFDQLKGSKLKMVVKGTYESNSPKPWLSTVLDDDNMTVLPPSGIDSSAIPSGYDSLPTVCKLDIAEIKIGDERFANYREVYQRSMTDTDPFFDGTGLDYRCDDVRYKRSYSTLNMYMRKNAFDNAHSFLPSTGLYDSLVKSLFNEVYSAGYDFILHEVWSMYDYLREERSDLNRIYPLSISFDTPFYYTDDDDYTLEVRLVVKNYIKRYETITTNSDDATVSYHYFGFSDWARDVLPGDTYTGGNLMGVARWYSKKKATTVKGSVPAGSIVIAIPAENTIDEYILSSTDRERPADMFSPRSGSSGGSDIIPAMEYLVDQEKYKGDYSQYYTSLTTDFSVYSDTWTNYNTKINSLKIPPLAVYTADGNFVMENVQSGRSYKFFYTSASSYGMGELPSSFTGSGTEQLISTDYAGGTYTVTSF